MRKLGDYQKHKLSGVVIHFLTGKRVLSRVIIWNFRYLKRDPPMYIYGYLDLLSLLSLKV